MIEMKSIFFVLSFIFLLVPFVMSFGNGDDCSNTDDCDGFLECIEEKCICAPGSVFLGTDCFLLSSSNCVPPTIGSEQRCILHANCITGEQGTSTCICDAANGFESNAELRCFLPFDAVCENFSTECDPVGFLTCGSFPIRCACKDKPNMYYEPAKKMCYLLTGSSCSKDLDFPQCTTNAICLNNGCTCVDDYEPDDSRKCILPKLEYGQSCHKGLRDYCDRSKFLECGTENQCVCANSDNTYFDFNKKVCKLRAGALCTSSGQECIDNSRCELNDGVPKCTCRADLQLKPNKIGQCVLTHGELCTLASDFCDKQVRYLQCGTSGVCECMNKLNSFFDYPKDECVLLVNSNCLGAGNQECVRHAVCQNGICQCSNHFLPNPDRKCYLPHGAPCTQADDNCDSEHFQVCGSNNICICQNEYQSYFDKVNGMCFLGTGSDCSPMANTQPCTPNSKCDGILRKCTCDGQLQPNPEQKCVLNYDALCNPEKDLCDNYGFLECGEIGNAFRCTCQHSTDTWFDPISSSCKLLANAECSTLDGAQECVPRAPCTRTPGGVPYKCICENPLDPNRHRQCFLKFNSTCDTITDDCDPDGFLKCNPQNKCACAHSDQQFFPDAEVCLVIPGGKCSPIGENEPHCVPHASCSKVGQCNCDTYYEDTGKASCHLKFNTPCTKTPDDCNFHKRLECVGGLCGCKLGFLPTTGTEVECLVGFNYPCNEELVCNKEASLYCHTGACLCLSPPDQDYEQELKKCVSLVGKRCSLYPDETGYGALFCVPNAVCNQTTNINTDIIYGTCECETGYSATDSKRCVASGKSTNLVSFAAISFSFCIYFSSLIR